MKTSSDINSLGFLRHLLQRDHGIECHESFLWQRIYNDSDRKRELAMEMLQDLCDDSNALSAFAITLKAVQPQIKIVSVVDRGACNFMLGVGVIAGMVVGLLVGVVL